MVSSYCADCDMPQPMNGSFSLHLEGCVQHRIGTCICCRHFDSTTGTVVGESVDEMLDIYYGRSSH